MTEAQAIELIAARMATTWPGASSNVPFSLENEAMLTSLLSSADTFAALSVTHTTATQISMNTSGARRIERKGYIMVKVWTPADAGRQASAQLADVARAVFEGVSLSPGSGEPITILAGETAEVGTDGRWFMLVVRFPFRYYATV